MPEFFHHFAIGSAGAAAFEALKVWELTGRLTETRFRRMLTSLKNWCLLVSMLAASGFLAWALYAGKPDVTPWNLAMSGIVIRTTVRELMSAAAAHSMPKLGDDPFQDFLL
jgi:hypothetical protein